MLSLISTNKKASILLYKALSFTLFSGSISTGEVSCEGEGLLLEDEDGPRYIPQTRYSSSIRATSAVLLLRLTGTSCDPTTLIA